MDTKTDRHTTVDPTIISTLYEPRYWELRAKEMRALAAAFKEPNAQLYMLRIASDYERLAELVRHLP
jgi:hypothetical protein